MKRPCDEWALCFIAFSMIGWCYEVAIMYLEFHQGFVNRGFLYGPWLPIYGFGGIFILLLFERVRERKLAIGKISFAPLVCFLLICLLTTALELGSSYLVERFVGHTLWDYRGTGYGPTFQGRIALRSSLQFGVIGMVMLYGIEPLMRILTAAVKRKCQIMYWVFFVMLSGLFLIDLGYHVIHGSHATW